MPSVLHVLPHRGGGAETYVDILEALDGYRHRRVALSATREPFGAAASIALGAPRLVRAARAADVVHAHGDVATLLATPLLRARPAVVTTHGLHLLRRSNGARGSAVRRALRVALGGVARVLCTSAAERDQLAASLPSALARRLVVAHNAVPAALEPSAAERERARHGLGLAPGDVVALYLGQLEARKRPLDAARAAIAARAGGAPIVLIVAGDGPQRGELAALAGDAVRVLGQRDDATALLAAADVFVMPSEREGLSFAVLEAMAHGIATVVSDGAGNPEAVGDAGIVVPVGATERLAEALRRLASDERERARLGVAARERALRSFAPERLRDAVAAAYAGALAEG